MRNLTWIMFFLTVFLWLAIAVYWTGTGAGEKNSPILPILTPTEVREMPTPNASPSSTIQEPSSVEPVSPTPEKIFSY